MRGVAAAFASDFDVFLKTEKTHIQNTERHFQEQKNVTRDFRTWAEKKEDDIRVRIIASRTAAIEDALAAREALLVHELSAARTTLKEIKHRSKTIDDAQQSLAQLIKKRDSINRNESELEHWRHEARKADQHLKHLQAAHSGATRRDLQSAFIRKHEAIIKYTDAMRTASQFAIHMWNQLPQGELRPGQDIPAFTAEQLETLHRIMNDFEKALGVVEANRINTSTTAAASVNTAAPSRLSSLAPPTYTSSFTQSTGDTDTSYTLDDSFSFATSHNANLDNASTSEFSISTVTPTAIQRDSVSQIQRGAQGLPTISFEFIAHITV
ncbi:hypothetical protein HDU79_003626 [Rhizoclosmatium sp. JEL0117]|nr:hypothetical protein HDU79_003626 [Rhizoclosmatium sp. JEL0117]